MILIAVAIVIMALTDAAPFFDDVTEEQRVTDTVERFFAAFEERDFAAVCSLFSTDVRQEIEQVGATQTKQGEPKGCAEILEARYAAVPDEQTKLGLKIEDVRVQRPARGRRRDPQGRGRSRRGARCRSSSSRAPDGWLVSPPGDHGLVGSR